MINVYGSISNLGYGVHACNMVKALIENGQDINLTTIGQQQLDPYFEIYCREAINNKDKFNSSNPSIFIFHDEHSTQAVGNPLLTFSIFETTKPKDESINVLNNGLSTGILTTTKKHKEILSQFIKDKQIHVINEGVDDCLFNTIPIDKYIDTKKFTYITTGKVEERKNTNFILKTFITKMKDKNVALIAHTFNLFVHKINDHPFKNLNCWSGINPLNYGFEYKGFDGKAHKFTHNDCDIYFTAPIIPVSLMPSLYHSANVGIQVSRSEGWDLPCILPGTKIITNNGVKNIENVNKYDKLLSHTGHFRNINKIMKHKNTQRAFDIKCWGNDETLKATEEHPIYGIKKENITNYSNINNLIPEWIKTKDIKKGDILIKSTAIEEKEDTIIDLKTLDNNLLFDENFVWYKTSYKCNFKNSISNLCSIYNTSKHIIEVAIKIAKGRYINNKTNSKCTYISNKLKKDNIIFNKPLKIKRYININEISEIIGLYIAEGSNDKSKICFSIHEKEKKECLDMIKNNLKSISNDVSFWIKKHKNTKAIDICVSGKIISKLFEHLCNKGAHNKKIPKEILYGSKISLEKLIKWYHFGDGCTSKNNKSISTVSVELANQVCIALQRLGIIPRKHSSKHSNEFTSNSTFYTVGWIENKKERKIGSGNRIWNNNNNLAILVKEIKEIEYTGDVYNFEVDIDNSYTLCACTVHNCTEMLACGLPTIATNCLGHSEYLDNNDIPMVQKDLIVNTMGSEIAIDNIWFKGNQGEWDILDYDAFDTILFKTYNNQSDYLNKCDELADYIATNYSWNNSITKLLDVIDIYK